MSTPENTARRWSDRGWTAEIVQNEDGGGWALSMTHQDLDEPVLVVPWVMGRNKKDPKPLNKADFGTQVKAAQDFLTRSRQQAQRAHRVSRDIDAADGQRVRVVFDVIPDEYDPEGQLVATTMTGQELGRATCPAHFKLTREAAKQWVDQGFQDLYDDAPAW